MRAHLASTAVVAIALAASGCGAGRATRDYGALPKATPAPAAPPVVVAAPAAAAPAAKPAPAPAGSASARSRAAARRARHQRTVAARRLRAEHTARVRERRRAAARAKRLRQELAAARIGAPQPSHRASTHAKAPAAPITASDTVDDRQRAARVIVVRFHELMNAHDGSACDLLSVNFLRNHFPGADADAQRTNCAAGVQSIQVPVSVYVVGSGVESTGIWVRVQSRFGDAERDQVMHLVPFVKSWMIDSVEPTPSR